MNFKFNLKEGPGKVPSLVSCSCHGAAAARAASHWHADAIDHASGCHGHTVTTRSYWRRNVGGAVYYAAAAARRPFEARASREILLRRRFHMIK